jgi:translation initiation factor 2B subunit (eIF-2B alpha/beta/delta family)
MKIPAEIEGILEDRESGSVALLNRLIAAFEGYLNNSEYSRENVVELIGESRKGLNHFTAIGNFLDGLALCVKDDPQKTDPGNALEFISEYQAYWQDSPEKMASNLLAAFPVEGATLLTHSHSQTIQSVLKALINRDVSFRVLQTLSLPAKEGNLAMKQLRSSGIEVELVMDELVGEALPRCDVVLLGCDALTPKEFLNKAGSRYILEKARETGIASAVLAESRKTITRADWESGLPSLPLFEWITLDLVDTVVSE